MGLQHFRVPLFEALLFVFGWLGFFSFYADFYTESFTGINFKNGISLEIVQLSELDSAI